MSSTKLSKDLKFSSFIFALEKLALIFVVVLQSVVPVVNKVQSNAMIIIIYQMMAVPIALLIPALLVRKAVAFPPASKYVEMAVSLQASNVTMAIITIWMVALMTALSSQVMTVKIHLIAEQIVRIFVEMELEHPDRSAMTGSPQWGVQLA